MIDAIICFQVAAKWARRDEITNLIASATICHTEGFRKERNTYLNLESLEFARFVKTLKKSSFDHLVNSAVLPFAQSLRKKKCPH